MPARSCEMCAWCGWDGWVFGLDDEWHSIYCMLSLEMGHNAFIRGVGKRCVRLMVEWQRETESFWIAVASYISFRE